MNQYEKLYIQALTNNTTVKPPDPARANGHFYILRALHNLHEKGGPEAAKSGLKQVCEKDPEFKKALYPPSKWELITPAEMKTRPPREWLILNFVQKLGLTEIHGNPGDFKSMYTLYQCGHLAHDKKILYLITEGSGGLSSRIKGWESLYGEMSANLSFCETAVKLDKPEDVELFIKEVRDFNPDLIVCDTLINCRSANDENSSAEIQNVLEGCKRIIKELQTAMVLLHHTSRSGNNPRGSNNLDAGCDVMVHIKRKNTKATVSHYKTRDQEAFADQHFELVSNEHGVTLAPVETQDTENLDNEDPNALSPHEYKVLEILASSPFDEDVDGVGYTDMENQFGGSKGKFSDVKKRLKRDGFIMQKGTRGKYFITQLGQEALISRNDPDIYPTFS